MRRFARCLLIGGSLTFLGSASAADAGTGFSPGINGAGWARWQGRVAVNTGVPLWRNESWRSENNGLNVQAFGLMGDYYFTHSQLGQYAAGGFRATSGVLLGNATSVWAPLGGAMAGGLSFGRRNTSVLAGLAGTESTSDSGTVPYFGVGYTGLSMAGGWGFAADLGLKGIQSGSAVRLGRGVNGSQNLDELVRELRMRPVLQLGVSYSF